MNLYFRGPGEVQSDLVLTVSVDHAEWKTAFELLIPFEDLYFFPDGSQNRVPRDEDIQIVFPGEGNEVYAGQTIPLRIQFSEHVPRPRKLLILSPEYLLEDEDVRGRYSLRIEADTAPGPYDILVIGVWDRDGREMTASQRLSLRVVSKKLPPLSRSCPLSGRE